MTGAQGPQGPRTLNVANTAFVDNIFPSATPVVEDAANPFATIAAAIAAVTAARGAITTTPWRVVVRPGTYPETAAGNVITPIPNLTISGSGPATIINARLSMTVTSSPVTVEGFVQNIPTGTLNLLNNSVLTARSLSITSTQSTGVFQLAGAAPSLTISGCSISLTSTTSSFTSIFLCTGGNPSATLDANDIEITTTGYLPQIMLATVITSVTATVRNLVVNATLTTSSTRDGLYVVDFGGLAPPAVNLLIDDCDHRLTYAIPASTPATTIFYLVNSSGTPPAGSRYVVRDSLFQFVDYPATSSVNSAIDNATTGDFVQLLDNKWSGLTIVGPATTTYVPQASGTSVPVVYEGLSGSGSVVWSGGLQTGVTTVPAASTTYTVLDGDAIIVWAPTAAATLTMTASSVFIGKWVTVYNSNAAGGANITISSSGPANGTVVVPTESIILQTYDGTNWFVAARS